MLIPRKSRYALRAVFELSKRHRQGPVSIGEIAEAQAIPHRFLEAILNQLRQASITSSQRGKAGGYELARAPSEITVGDVLTVVQGPVELVGCSGDDPTEECPLSTNCVFLPMWDEVREAISSVYDRTTFGDLVSRERALSERLVPSWSI